MSYWPWSCHETLRVPVQTCWTVVYCRWVPHAMTGSSLQTEPTFQSCFILLFSVFLACMSLFSWHLLGLIVLNAINSKGGSLQIQTVYMCIKPLRRSQFGNYIYLCRPFPQREPMCLLFHFKMSLWTYDMWLKGKWWVHNSNPFPQHPLPKLLRCVITDLQCISRCFLSPWRQRSLVVTCLYDLALINGSLSLWSIIIIDVYDYY